MGSEGRKNGNNLNGGRERGERKGELRVDGWRVPLNPGYTSGRSAGS